MEERGTAWERLAARRREMASQETHWIVFDRRLVGAKSSAVAKPTGTQVAPDRIVPFPRVRFSNVLRGISVIAMPALRTFTGTNAAAKLGLMHGVAGRVAIGSLVLSILQHNPAWAWERNTLFQ